MAIDERERPVLELLDEMGIPYRRYEHPCARTMHDCEGIGADIGAQHFKNLFLCNRSGTKFYLLLICADKPFRTGDVSRQLGSSRLSFCSDAQLMDKLGLVAGSVTPMALYRAQRHPCRRDARQRAAGSIPAPKAQRRKDRGRLSLGI